MEIEPATRPLPASGAARGFIPGAAVAMLLLVVSWIWWALEDGAYFTGVFNPGAILLFAGFGLLLWTSPWRARLSLSRPARIAVLAMAGLAAWTLASILWSPSPDISVSDAQRVLVYLVAFALGAWLCNMLAARMELALLPIVIATGIVGIVTVVVLLTRTDLTHVFGGDGTLLYPLGYRNAVAAFFLIAVWPSLALASSAQVDRRLRLICAVVATLSIELAALSQSRGSFLGAGAGLVVFLLASRERPRALAWLIITALPLVIVVPLASQLFESASGSPGSVSIDAARSAGQGALLGVAVSAAFSAILLSVDDRLPAHFFAKRSTALLVTGLALVLALFAFSVKVGSPIGWVGDRFDQFEAGEPDLSKSSSRFTFNAGSERSDIWRVAIDATKDDPLFGEGSGGFEYRYLKDRHAVNQVARDAHSVELEMLSELGIPGFGLLVLALGGSVFAILRARKLGPAASTLSTGALAAGAYWLVHTSVDWFWAYPAVTAPVFALLGAACAPTMLYLGRPAPQRGVRIALGLLAAVVGLSMIPGFLSDRYLDNAYAEFRTDLPAAYNDVDKAKTLSPLSDEPLLGEGAIAKSAGDRKRAISSFEAAIRKRPEQWAGHFFLAEIYAKHQPKLALAQLAAASELNPLSDEIPPLRKRIKRNQAHPGGTPVKR